ncbi:MAG: electron transfer flavoprotein subunit alpha [Erysipelothrix sp.]|nr:electron transfer flavoprotein subunit alpha [Erysipelothrix sp.]
MSGIVIDHDKCIMCGLCVPSCPFNALEDQGKIIVNENCKVCKICIGVCPTGAISLQEEIKEAVDKSIYSGILVFVEHFDGEIHPVTIELIGKAQQLAKTINEKVNCLMIGSDIQESADSLLDYGVSEVIVYDDPAFKYFKVDNYANAFEEAIKYLNPSSVLVGATTTGRSLAPRVATRFRTGLTADCTVLEMRDNSDLVQIRPAFGGNIMAQILTTNSRPQFATVRPKVMDAALKQSRFGTLTHKTLDPIRRASKIKINEIFEKASELDISSAEVLVVAGNGIKDEAGFALCEDLAKALNGTLAVTRPVVERGYYSYLHQIGLSGRTVKPKLIINCGISGAIQYTAGMNQSEMIVSINSDENAEIFKHSDIKLVGDVYEIIPELLAQIKGGHN